jgi:ABC-2 type transport system permease protein
MVASSFAPALLLAVAVIVWGLLEQGSSLLDPIRPLLEGLPEEIKAGPKGYRTAFWTMAFSFFFSIQTFFAMILVLVVGPDLISQDLRFNAIPLYFAKPLTRFDYFAGKLGVIGFFLAMVTVVPAAAAWLLGVAFSFELSVLRDTGRILLASIGFGLLLTLSAGTLMLALSSLTRNSRFVGAMFIGLWIVSNMAASVLIQTIGHERSEMRRTSVLGGLQPFWRAPEGSPESEPDWSPIVSYTRDLGRVREAMLGTVDARDRFLALAARTQEAAGGAAREVARQSVPFGGLLPRARPAEPDELVLPPPPPPLRLEADRYPWTWAAGVLLGLFVLSFWILTTRVKSLDRLK